MLHNLSIRAILTGIFFGIWPLLMNRSGLSGNVSSFVLVVIMLGCILPFSVGNLGSIFNPDVKLLFAMGASVCGGAGILLLNSILANNTPTCWFVTCFNFCSTDDSAGGLPCCCDGWTDSDERGRLCIGHNISNFINYLGTPPRQLSRFYPI